MQRSPRHIGNPRIGSKQTRRRQIWRQQRALWYFPTHIHQLGFEIFLGLICARGVRQRCVRLGVVLVPFLSGDFDPFVERRFLGDSFVFCRCLCQGERHLFVDILFCINFPVSEL